MHRPLAFALTAQVSVVGCLSTTTALATVPPVEVVLLNDGPIPANGVLHFSDPPALGTITVTSGTLAFDGSLDDGAVWRPSSPLTPGLLYEYQATPRSSAYAIGSRGTFTVVDAYTPAAHTLLLEPRLAVDARVGGTVVCCEPDPSTRSLGHGCYHAEFVEYAALVVTVQSPLPKNLAGQYTYRLVEYAGLPIGNGSGGSIVYRGEQTYRELASLSYIVRVPPDLGEYCVTFAATSLITGDVFTTRRCVPNTVPSLGSRPRRELGEMNVRDCPLPPVGFEELWCDALWGQCEYHFDSTTGVERERQIERCSGYRKTCKGSPPPPGAPPSFTSDDARSCVVGRGASAPSSCAIIFGLATIAVIRSRRRVSALVDDRRADKVHRASHQ